MKHCLTLVLTLLLTAAFAQDQKAEQIVKSVGDYFLLERENIHVQMDKSVFFTNETIWLKGYVYHRKKKQPFFSSTNIYASLIDESGKVIDSKLLYGSLGSFVGFFTLDESFASGKYYIQFYTNWMNNFTEDESFVEKITIVNEKDNPAKILRQNIQPKLSINAEGGTYLLGQSNNFGITVTGCDGHLVPAGGVDIIGQNGKSLIKVQLNKLGHGRVELPAGSEPVKAVAIIDGKAIEAVFPVPSPKGFAMAVNSYALKGNTVIKLTTNTQTLADYNGKPLYLMVHQDDKASVFLLNLNSGQTGQTVSIPSANMYDGMNTIRLIDENMKELAVRIMYNHPTSSVTSSITKTGKSETGLKFRGNVTHPNMNLSISVLPENTISQDGDDIYGSLLIAPYLKDAMKPAGRHYFSLSRSGLYELDLLLLSQEPKYSWYNINNSPPRHSFTFDMGITLKGRVPQGVSLDKNSRVRLYALNGINEYAAINEGREFVFDHLVIQDSSWVNFTVTKINEKSPKVLNIVPQTLQTGTKYFKSYKPETCDTTSYVREAGEQYTAPTIFKNTVELDEVVVEGKALKYASSFGNSNLRGFKMSDYNMGNSNILTWLRTYSNFDVVDNIDGVAIYNRTRTSINGAASGPIVYVDNVQQIDLGNLRNILMTEVDEVYLNSHTIVPSLRNFMGMIKIYLKKGGKRTNKNATPDIVIKNAFQRARRFENASYATETKGYENFGVVDWHPIIMTDEDGNFNFEIPQTSQKKVKILIEGFSADGKLISEIKTIGTE